MSDGRKAAYEDEMEEWMDRQVRRFQQQNTTRVVQDLKIIADMLDDFRNTDPVLTSANHSRIATVRKMIGELLK